MVEKSAPKKTDRRVIKTQRAIRQAFRKLLVENGLEKITVSALAREADIDRKTFYLHYSSIDALIQQEANILVDRVAKALSSPAKEGGELTPFSMKCVLIELANVVEENSELYHHVISSLSIDQMVDALHEPVRRAALESNKELGRADERGFDYIIRFYIAGTLSVFTRWFIEDRESPIESVVDVVERVVGPFAFKHGFAIS